MRGAKGTGVAAALALVAVLGTASPASAATVIGRSDVTPTSACDAGTLVVQASTAAAPDYVAPSDGVITSWTWRAGAVFPGAAKLVAFRATVPPAEFRIVGRSSQVAFTANSAATSLTRIPVRAGDRIGLRTEAPMACALASAAPADLIRFAIPPDEPPDGATVNLANAAQYVMPLSAGIEPDGDGDGFGDESQDNCLDSANPDQRDRDGDGIGNPCDPADDNDRDGDGDGVLDVTDNCLKTANPGQADSDGDGAGNACDLPDTDITEAKALVRTKKKKGRLKATFISDHPDATFACALDGDAPAPCSSPFRVKAKLGKHTLNVTAVNEAGADPLPAKHRFEVVPK